MNYEVKIQFATGVTIDMDSEVYDIDKLSLKMRENGMRPFRIVDKHGVINIIPLNSQNIARIYATPIKEEVEESPEPVTELTDAQIEKIMREQLDEDKYKEKAEPKKPKTNDELLDILVERSNCQHDFADMKLGFKQTANGKRYQPYCTKKFSDGSTCTYRGRFVGAQKVKEGRYETTPTPWTVEDLLTAKQLLEIN
jgi:hypothetical protein